GGSLPVNLLFDDAELIACDLRSGIQQHGQLALAGVSRRYCLGGLIEAEDAARQNAPHRLVADGADGVLHGVALQTLLRHERWQHWGKAFWTTHLGQTSLDSVQQSLDVLTARAGGLYE